MVNFTSSFLADIQLLRSLCGATRKCVCARLVIICDGVRHVCDYVRVYVM